LGAKALETFSPLIEVFALRKSTRESGSGIDPA
jgi:hypothetical protein